MKILTSFLIYSVSIGLLSNLGGFILLPILIFQKIGSMKGFFKDKNIVVLSLFLGSLVASYISITTLQYIENKFSLISSLIPIIIYTLLLIHNDLARISKTKKNASSMELMADINGSTYDKKFDLRKEIFSLIGGVIGIIISLLT